MQTPIREIIRASDFHQWEIAEAMNVSESWLSKTLRHEPDELIRKRIILAIETLKQHNQ